jgi:membrane-bound metal-dependent hydrolase YbcI (DUF457 family)
MVARQALALQGAVFFISVFTILLFAGEAAQFPLGRVLFAIFVSSLCSIAELYVVVQGVRFLWKLSGRITSRRASGKLQKSGSSGFDRAEELPHIDNARGEQ